MVKLGTLNLTQKAKFWEMQVQMSKERYEQTTYAIMQPYRICTPQVEENNEEGDEGGSLLLYKSTEPLRATFTATTKNPLLYVCIPAIYLLKLKPQV